MSRRPFFIFATLFVLIGLLAGCASPAKAPADSGTTDGKLKVIGIYASLIQEPWDGVIHAALTKALAALDRFWFTSDPTEKADRITPHVP